MVSAVADLSPMPRPSAEDVERAIRRAQRPVEAEAYTLGRPVFVETRRAVAVLHFLQPTLVRKQILYVPFARSLVDRDSLAILELRRPIRPSDLGVDDVERRRVAGFRLPGSTGQFWDGREATFDLSGDVWDDWFEGRSGPEVDDRARRYAEAAHLSTFAAIVPYLRGAAPDFARWLDQRAPPPA